MTPENQELSASLSPQSIVIRSIHPDDGPAVWALLDDYRPMFQDDYETLSPGWVLSLVNSGEPLVLEAEGYPIGMAWYSDIRMQLHAMIHVLFRPQYLRAILKQGLLESVLDYGFQTLDLRKIKAMAMSTQTTAIKLLRRYQFKQCGLFRKETRQHGKLIDVLAFELSRGYWKRHARQASPKSPSGDI